MTSAREEEEEVDEEVVGGAEGRGDVAMRKAVRGTKDGSQPGQLSLGNPSILESQRGIQKGTSGVEGGSGSMLSGSHPSFYDTLSGVSKNKQQQQQKEPMFYSIRKKNFG